MKRILFLALVLSATITFISCSKDDDVEDVNGSEIYKDDDTFKDDGQRRNYLVHVTKTMYNYKGNYDNLFEIKVSEWDLLYFNLTKTEIEKRFEDYKHSITQNGWFPTTYIDFSLYPRNYHLKFIPLEKLSEKQEHYRKETNNGATNEDFAIIENFYKKEFNPIAGYYMMTPTKTNIIEFRNNIISEKEIIARCRANISEGFTLSDSTYRDADYYYIIE